MNKFAAREALRTEIAKQTGQNIGGRVLNDSSVTLAWFVRNRYFPLRQGNRRPETAKEKKSRIEHDLLAKSGEIALDSLDRFVLQTHLDDLADRFSQDRVQQARSYMKSILDEAIDQEFLLRDPTRKLKIPKIFGPRTSGCLLGNNCGRCWSRPAEEIWGKKRMMR